MTDNRQPTTFTTSSFVAAVLVAVAACTTRNPNYQKSHSDAAESSELGSLSVVPGSLAPAFDSGTTTYSVSVASTASSVAVTAVPQDNYARVTANGQEINSGQQNTISLNGAGVNTPIVIAVMTTNGGHNTYLVTVNRAALGGDNKLDSLSVSPGSLAPAFDSSTTSYSVNVANTANTVAISATLQDSSASMAVNGQQTSSGQQRSIPLNALEPVRRSSLL